MDSDMNTSPTNSSLPWLSWLSSSLGQLSMATPYGANSCFTGW
jgi:hypothetical protein